MSFLKRINAKIGIDSAIAYSSGARVIQSLASIGTLFFISTYLSGVEQGFYFTFGSIVAVQVFFELGLTGIMTQYVAHEASHITLSENNTFQGEKRYCSRLASLVRFCTKWYLILSVFVFLFLLIVGYIYFSKYGDSQSEVAEWKLPWILVCIGTAIKLFQSPFTSILSGLGYIRDVSKITFYQQLTIPIFTCVGLIFGLKLYVLGIGYILSVVVWQVYVSNKGLLSILINLLKSEITEKVDYLKEIFPYQWRIALSWVSGYFIYQLFNPVLFATEGAVVAGQMGMTLQVLSAIQSFSLSWLNTKIPLYSKLIANNNYIELDTVFNKTLKQMTTVCAFLLVLFFVFICALQIFSVEINGKVIADKFLKIAPLVLMIIPVYIQQYSNSWATYLRCHKKEPFLIISVVSGILCMLSTMGLNHIWGLSGIVGGYFCIQVIVFPWSYYIFKTRKNQWHSTALNY